MIIKIPKGVNTKWENDIFIDVQVANRFSNATDPNYKNLIMWLLEGNAKDPKSGALILSTKLITKYFAGNEGDHSPTGIRAIISILYMENRYNSVGDDIVNAFFRKHFLTKGKKRIKKSKNSYEVSVNNEDKYLFPVVFNSNRKMAVIRDKKFLSAVLNWKPFSKGVVANDCPGKLNYK